MQVVKKGSKISIFSYIILSICISLFNSCASVSEKDKDIANQNLYIEYQNIADTFVAQEKYDKAITYYNLALENKDTYWNVYYKLAKAYAFQKKWPEAEEMYKTLLNRDPDNSTLKESLAYIYSMNGNYEEAKLIYDELMALFPEVKEYLENYISILISQKDFDAVSVPLYLLIEQFPDSTNIKTFQNEYDKYIQEQKELNKQKSYEATSDEDESDSDESIILNENVNKNPEEANLQIENIEE